MKISNIVELLVTTKKAVGAAVKKFAILPARPKPAYYNDEDFEFQSVRWLHSRGR
jgi:hypothetical protein